MLTLLLSANWRTAHEEILGRISRDVHERRGGRILMVPELISHDTERSLCARAGDTASRYAEVMSFTGLGRRVSESVGAAAAKTLDSGGRVVAMAACARQLSSRLKAYAAVETKPEFLKDLIDAIDEFKRCCISPGDLALAASRTEGAFAQKLEELSLLMGSYDALCARGKRDPRDAMVWLQEQLESGDYAREHTFYIDGFPDFTRQHLAILESLMIYSPAVTVALNTDCVDSHALAFEKAGTTARLLYAAARRYGVEVRVEVLPETADALAPMRQALYQGSIAPGVCAGALRTVRADSPWTAVQYAAEQIQRLVSQGARYRDINLVCPDAAVYANIADLVFERMHIPLYRSGTEEILHKSIIATVLSSLDVAVSDFDAKSMVRYLRSGLSPVTADEGDEVENYMITWGIRGSAWRKPWVNHPDGLEGKWDERANARLTRLNACRERILAPLEKLRRGLDKAANLRAQVLSLYDFLEDIELARLLEQQAEALEEAGESRQAQILSQLWEILVSALEQLHDVLGDSVWSCEHFVRLLSLLLSQYDVGTIPPVLDAVQFGPVSALRCRSARHVFVLGVQEGSMPGYSGSRGILTDRERTALRDLGVPLTGGAVEGISSEFAEIYGVFAGSMESVTAICDSEPSFLFRRLTRLSGQEEQATVLLGCAGAEKTDAAYYLASFGAEGSAQTLGLADDYREACAHRDYTLGSLSPASIGTLYGQSLRLSASQIDTQADCRRRYFLQYGLRAKERKEAAVDPTQFGTFVHAVLEDTARTVMERGGFHQVSLPDTLEIARGYSDAYIAANFSALDSERSAYLLARNRQELDMVVEDLWQELSQSSFAPVGFEVGFDDGELLPAIEIPNDTLTAILRGFVDRVDVYQRLGSKYYRVVDYKTGKKDFDYCDVFNGLGLQMLLYLFALSYSGAPLLGEGAYGAGIQYFPARAPYLSVDGSSDDRKAEKDRTDGRKRKGLVLDDGDILSAMEPSDSPKYLDITYKKDGTVTGNIASREQMKMLETYVFSILRRLIAEIASGNTEPNPYTRGSEHDACNFCPYGPVCRGTQEAERRNYKTMSSREFWDALVKEVADHG